jgi:glycosyltransferase involved in cell wall biosynthesis
MKIFLLADGSSSHTKKWVLSLLSQGLHLYLFSLNKISEEILNEPNNRLRVYSADMGAKTKASNLGKLIYLKLLPKLKSEISEFKPDLLHAHYISSYGLLAFLSGFRPYLLSAWGSDLMVFPKKSALHRATVVQILKSARMVFATSEILLSMLQKDFMLKNAAKIPFGVDMDLFNNQGKTYSKEGVKFIIVKSLTKTYGIDIAINAFIQLLEKYPDKQIRLDIYGDGPLREEYEHLADHYLGNAIVFHGKIPHQKVPEKLKQSDVFVNISRSESFGVSVLEASACGLAVIVSNRGGLPEVILDEKSGLILAELNEKECFEAMENYILNPELIQMHGKSGRSFVQQNYTEQQSVDKQIEAYHKIIESK